ncbi:MAG TPA: UPF0182 family protein, partial [Acidimicrobiales bacterium]|nr:UPF0182 family protein [Acidimicrobiales bacterium]
MRAPTDLPRRRRPSNRVGLVLVGIVAFVLLLLAISLRGIAGFYTDYLWFGELGLSSVWSGVLGTKVGLAVAFTIAFFLIMWINLAIADLIAPRFRPMGPEEQVVERYHAMVGPHGGLVRIGVAVLFALVAGPGASGQWNSWILFRNRLPFGASDAQFDRDIGFFVFQLPFLKFVVDWLFAAVVIVLIVTAVAHYLNGGIRFQTPLQKVTPQVKVHLSVLLAVLALLKAVGYYLQRFELVYSTRGVVQGAGYTDVKAQLPALQLLIFISLFASALVLVNILRRGWVLPVAAVGLWALVSVAAGTAYPAFVQQFRVRPTESDKERPYIDRNIRATRAAFNLRDTKVNNFDYSTDLNAAALEDNQETIRNVRLWDPPVLEDTYKRLQEIRNFYQFDDVDVDRYGITGSGRTTQILIAARELNVAGIPSPSWVNQHLVYTHGYGVVASPANAVAPDGNPDLLVRDIPPQSSETKLRLETPAVYYGPATGGYAIVNTKQREVDYTDASGTNRTSTYNGVGGVRMSSWYRRAALALRFGDPNPFISGFITPSSKAIYIRDIDDRVRKAAPFLKYDSDPYPIVYKGRMLWIYDAYTTTSRYPYSERADTTRLAGVSGLNSNFNYVRNSVKVAIDAYDGTMTYYVMDSNDPIVRAYQKAFPKLFTDGSRMEPELREHLRYPEDLFRVQTNMYGRYHMLDAAEFYNNTDAWEIAQAPGAVGNATSVVGAGGQIVASREPRMVPYYLLTRLPDEEDEEFLILQPFVPLSRDDSRKDLTAFVVAKGDPDNYGELEAFVMPRQQQIDGPALVNARVNQQPEISQQITLLNTSGSKVILGNLLLVPVERSLLYIQPLYVRSEATPLPQLKKVIVVYSDQVVMRDSLQGALTEIFGSAPSTLEQVPVGETPPPLPSPDGTPPITVAPGPG